MRTSAFALLGPIQPWMEESNGVILPWAWDIGGPMNIGEGYRWNVPVVTYGFDQSFLDYFGSNGVTAVEGAIQILNAMPPASQNSPTNYPFDSRTNNYAAYNNQLMDLKSVVLCLLLEHLGLASPTRYIYVLPFWDPFYATNGNVAAFDFDNWSITPPLIERNFDPLTQLPSNYVNNILYTALISGNVEYIYVVPYTVDPGADGSSSVTDDTLGVGLLNWGWFYTGLTYDDVGGLCYLYTTNNINYETLPPGVMGTGTNGGAFVNATMRPGVDKVTFIPQPVDARSGGFVRTTNYFVDYYVTNTVHMQQQLARVISQPDFLFSAGDLTNNTIWEPSFWRTGTTNWINDGVPNLEGPGVIHPPVQITFNKLQRQFVSPANYPEMQIVDESQYWGYFDNSSNLPVAYPATRTGSIQSTIHLWLSFTETNQQRFDWTTGGPYGSPYALQTSTNLHYWVTLFMATNNGSVAVYVNQNPSSAARFYRVSPQ
jgi:hypothetical protein